eukprot:GFYU01000528.1.p1 GENE.GFYU01000528.1~~GFYU01000528.1.p1  ORF type:complete len:1022 (-),score=314.10 GFYU01000528.1:296-3361(-)
MSDTSVSDTTVVKVQSPDVEQAPQTDADSAAGSDEGFDPAKPFWFSIMLVNRPYVIFFTCLIISVILSVVGFAVGGFSVDTGGRSFRVQTDTIVKNSDALEQARVEVLTPKKSENKCETEMSYEYGSVTLVYEAGNIFDISELKAICELESNLSSKQKMVERCFHTIEKTKRDLLDNQCSAQTNGRYPAAAYTTPCSTPESILNFAGWNTDASGFLSYNCGGINDATVTTIKTNIAAGGEAAKNYLHESYNGGGSTITRAKFVFGLPFFGFKNTDNPNPTSFGAAQGLRVSLEQHEQLTDWLEEEKWRSDMKGASISTYYRGTGITSAEFTELILTDSLLAIGSLAFIFIYACFHTRSLWATGMGLLGVLLSFPVAYFIYRIILAQRYMNTLNFLGLFVILGIGADDMFIFLDAWKQSANEPAAVSGSLHTRMAWTYRRSVTAMLTTSLTTSIAFFANAVSLIPPIRFFGVFMGLLVLANYALVITMFPAAVSIASRWGDKWYSCCACTRKEIDTKNPYEHGGSLEHAHRQHSFHGSVETQENMRTLERFFYKQYSDFLLKYKWVLLGITAVIVIISIVGSTFLTAADEPAQFLPDDHPFNKYSKLSKQFGGTTANSAGAGGGPGASQFVDVDIVFGVDTIDRSAADPDNLEDIGAVVWDNSFELSNQAAQVSIIQLCDKVKAARGQGRVSTDDETCDIPNGCWLDDFYTWLGQQTTPVVVDRTVGYDTSTDANKKAFYDDLNRFRLTFYGFAPTTCTDLKNNPKYFFSLGFTNANRADPTQYGRLQYAKLTFRDILESRAPAAKAREAFDWWQNLVLTHNANAPSSAQAYQTALKWISMLTEETLFTTAFSGAGTSLAIAFLIITLMSNNWIIGSIATLCIFCIVATVLAFMVVLGWDLGIIESINLTVLVGLAVDYVLHLAIAYVSSEHPDRFGKMRAAMYEMGISVLSAGITTAGASMLLFGTVIQFFAKFGYFLFITTFFSAYYAFIMFPCLMLVIGPEGETGKLDFLWNLCRKKKV